MLLSTGLSQEQIQAQFTYEKLLILTIKLI